MEVFIRSLLFFDERLFIHSWSCSSKCRDLNDMIVDVSFMGDPEFLDFVGISFLKYT